jgi:23S rRNA (adenine2503-C2)-methyltransferase
MTAEKASLLACTRGDLEAALVEMGEPKYRATQVLKNTYQRFARSFAEMTDLPAALREKLDGRFAYPAIQVDGMQHEPSGPTDKLLLSMTDGAKIEAVVMGNKNRPPTLCVSSQVGCPLGCKFCATGLMGFKRNLTYDELFGQIWLLFAYLRREAGLKASPNIVFMGMGEPLLNRRNLFAALEAICDPERLGLGDRHVTVSTIGVPEGIRELAKLELGVNLALSLHHPDEAPRRDLMPFAKAPLAEVMDALGEYARLTKRLVTFEYILLAGVNDRAEEAASLIRLIRAFGHPALVNLIPYNPVGGTPYETSSRNRMHAFMEQLKSAGIRTTLRRTQGTKIDAACGQLALKGFTPERPSVNSSLMR